MTAALEFLGDLQSLTIATAKTGDDQVVSPFEQGDQYRVMRRFSLQQLVYDQVGVTDDGIDQADCRRNLGDVFPAPFETQRILEPP